MVYVLDLNKVGKNIEGKINRSIIEAERDYDKFYIVIKDKKTEEQLVVSNGSEIEIHTATMSFNERGK